MLDALFPVVCFGKLPSFGDFVRHNAASREVLAFDEWLRQGLYFARTQLGPRWDQTFAAAPQYHFLFFPENADRFLSGLMQPSHDKSLRPYPFLVSLLIDRRRFPDAKAYLLPVVLSRFFDGGRQFVERALNGMEVREIVDQTQALNISELDHEVAASRYQAEFLEAMTVDKFMTQLFESFDNPRKYLVFKNLADILHPFRSRSVHRLNLGLRFPLTADPSTTSYEVCFWTQVCFTLLGFSHFAPILFWASPQQGTPGHLFLFFRQPSGRTFVQLLKPDVESEVICVVGEEGKDKLATVKQALSHDYRELLDSGNETLSQFLHGVKKVSDSSYYR